MSLWEKNNRIKDDFEGSCLPILKSKELELRTTPINSYRAVMFELWASLTKRETGDNPLEALFKNIRDKAAFVRGVAFDLRNYLFCGSGFIIVKLFFNTVGG